MEGNMDSFFNNLSESQDMALQQMMDQRPSGSNPDEFITLQPTVTMRDWRAVLIFLYKEFEAGRLSKPKQFETRSELHQAIRDFDVVAEYRRRIDLPVCLHRLNPLGRNERVRYLYDIYRDIISCSGEDADEFNISITFLQDELHAEILASQAAEAKKKEKVAPAQPEKKRRKGQQAKKKKEKVAAAQPEKKRRTGQHPHSAPAPESEVPTCDNGVVESPTRGLPMPENEWRSVLLTLHGDWDGASVSLTAELHRAILEFNTQAAMPINVDVSMATQSTLPPATRQELILHLARARARQEKVATGKPQAPGQSSGPSVMHGGNDPRPVGHSQAGPSTRQQQSDAVAVNLPLFTIVSERRRRIPKFTLEGVDLTVRVHPPPIQEELQLTLRHLRAIFSQLLESQTSHMEPHHRIRLTLNHPTLGNEIWLPFMRVDKLTVDVIMDEVEKVLQAHQGFTFDHNIVIHLIHVNTRLHSSGFSS
ncbi:uncharacterized protein LOC135489315 isoform X2 [Lineus longissimus]|uniref:uncharacterized protein LOC135489315 isoform X2 n=1 Tax=Lineus longissimus TaxID=88925 RepID=UPI00315C7AA1